MRVSTRLRPVVVLLAAIATVIGLAPNASAAYGVEPVGPSWVPNNSVHSVLVSGSTVYVGGDFTGNYAALDATTGALKWLGTANGDVRALALAPNGHLLLGGAFTTVGGVTHRKLASVDPTTGKPDAIKPAAGGTVRDIVVVGNVAYFAGAFTNHGGMTQAGLGAIDATTGANVTTFTTTTANGTAAGTVYALATDGTRLFFGGDFTAVSDSSTGAVLPRNQLASVPIGSSTPDAWTPPKPCTGSNVFWDIALKANRIFTAGRNCGALSAFDTGSNVAPKFIVKANGDAQAVTVAPDGSVYVGGHFVSVTVKAVTSARVLVAGFTVSNDTPVLLPFSAKFVTSYPGVWGLASTSTRLYVAGYFTQAGSVKGGHPWLAFF